MLVVPWRLAWGEWREGIPHEPLLVKKLPDPVARRLALKALDAARSKAMLAPKVVADPATTSVQLLASLPLSPTDTAQHPFFRDRVWPVVISVSWSTTLATRYAVSARIWRDPYQADWVAAYLTDPDPDDNPNLARRRTSDERTTDEASADDAALQVIEAQIAKQVTDVIVREAGR
jgi:hypothetical protein